MMYRTIFGRSFSRNEQKKLGYGAFIGSLIMALSIYTVLKHYLRPLSVLNLRLSTGAGLELLMVRNTTMSQHGLDMKVSNGNHWSKLKEINLNPMCNFSGTRSDFCEFKGNIAIQGSSSSIFVANSSQTHIMAGNKTSFIRPYARKQNAAAMELVRKWAVNLEPQTSNQFPSCASKRSVSAILFSLGGFSGNHFHDFTDLVIPLYFTSQQFNGQVQFVITDYKPWWVTKFQKLLQKLSRYEIVDIDREEATHCYQSLIVGLKSTHKELSIDPSNSLNDAFSMKDFRQFLRDSYSLKRQTAKKIGYNGKGKRPRLLIICRRRSRSFTNERKIMKMAKRVGYEVVAVEANLSTDISRFAEIVNSCDVLMGVHGAGLTNMVFLPDNAVLIQIVPLGGIDELARYDFGEPAYDMNIRYLEYKIKVKESSLIKQYPIDHVVFKDPFSVHRQGWDAVKSVYLVKQNVKLDVRRFRNTLLKALELLHH